MAFSPISGYIASVAIAETEYAFDKFSLAEDAALAEVTNFTSNGAQLMVAGVYKGDIKCSGPFDAGNMTAFAPNAEVDLILTFTAGVTVTVPCLVKSCTLNADVKDADRVDIELSSNGEFTLGPL